MLDLWQLKREFPQFLPWIDADFGSAAYLPLVDGANYRVTLSPSGGLIARPADAASEAKLKQTGFPFGSGTRTMWFEPKKGLVKLVFQHGDGSVSTVDRLR